jgi:hypothetical protein
MGVACGKLTWRAGLRPNPLLTVAQSPNYGGSIQRPPAGRATFFVANPVACAFDPLRFLRLMTSIWWIC